MTLKCSGRFVVLYHWASYIKMVEARSVCLQLQCNQKNLLFGYIHFLTTGVHITPKFYQKLTHLLTIPVAFAKWYAQRHTITNHNSAWLCSHLSNSWSVVKVKSINEYQFLQSRCHSFLMYLKPWHSRPKPEGLKVKANKFCLLSVVENEDSFKDSFTV